MGSTPGRDRDLLGRIAAVANESSTMEEALARTLGDICAHTGWPVGHVYLVEESPEPTRLVPSQLWHPAEPVGPDFPVLRRVTQATEFAPGLGMPGAVYESGRPMLIEDLRAVSWFVRAREPIEARAAFAFPVLVGTQVVAVIEFFSRQPAAPDPELLQLMAQIGTILGRVSERSRAQRELQATLERLQAANERLAAVDRLASIGQLAAGVAHDINNPAAFVLMNLEVMREHIDSIGRAIEQMRSQLDPPARELLDRIAGDLDVDPNLAELQEMIEENRGGMERIRSIVRDLSTFSRIDGAEIAQVRLDELARSAANLVEHEVRKRALLVTELDELPAIAADPNKISQALLALLVNAAEAIEPGRAEDDEVRITTRVDGDELVVTVSDTGAGIPADLQARIFEPFFTTKERGVGTGLGLSRALDIAHQHGGELSCQSTPGKGSRFELRLPVAAGAIAGARGGEARERGRVLVVDDDLQILKAYRRILSRVHEVTIAGSGREAIAILEDRADFDLIICDLVMPEIDGPTLFERITERGLVPADRIVFCSGASLGDGTRTFIEGLANPLLEKPVTPQRLLEVVEGYVHRRQDD